MTLNMYLAVTFIHQYLIQLYVYGQYDWHGGDWVMEGLKGTKEPIGVAGEWAHYANTLGETYDEIQEDRTTKQFVTARTREPPEWYPLSPEEVPYLAVLYRKDNGPSMTYKYYFEQEIDPGSSHIEAKTACGGVVLTPSYVLSVCGCLAALIAAVHGVPYRQENQFTDLAYQDYNILDSLKPYQNQTVFMTHSVVNFRPDFKYEINHDRNKWPRDRLLNCLDVVSQWEEINKNEGSDIAKTVGLMNSRPVLVPFKPSVKPEPVLFPKWPPHPVNVKVDPGFSQRVTIVSIGMIFSRPPGLKFFSSISASSILMKHCNSADDFVCNFTTIARGDNYTCFCPISSSYNLYGGTIGWPVVHLGELVGLTATRRDSRNGFLAAAVLSDEYIKAIEDFIGKKTLLEQNTVPPVYRQKDLGNKYFIYDYDKVVTSPVLHSKSTAGKLREFPMVTFCIILFGFAPRYPASLLLLQN